MAGGFIGTGLVSISPLCLSHRMMGRGRTGGGLDQHCLSCVEPLPVPPLIGEGACLVVLTFLQNYGKKRYLYNLKKLEIKVSGAVFYDV